MLKKRIIPCLDIKDGRTVKGVNFIGIRDAGNPVELAKKYAKEGADELVFLDITATQERRGALLELIKRISKSIDIPFTVGGGIKSVEDVSVLLKAGADKISINSSAVNRPNLITQIANEFGSQCVVVAVDIKNIDGVWVVFIHGGRTNTGYNVYDWVKIAENKGAGEILLTVMDYDGTKLGFAIEVTHKVNELVNIPVIASGGAGQLSDFEALFNQTKVSAGLAASIFHYNEVKINTLKNIFTK